MFQARDDLAPGVVFFAKILRKFGLRPISSRFSRLKVLCHPVSLGGMCVQIFNGQGWKSGCGHHTQLRNSPFYFSRPPCPSSCRRKVSYATFQKGKSEPDSEEADTDTGTNSAEPDTDSDNGFGRLRQVFSSL